MFTVSNGCIDMHGTCLSEVIVLILTNDPINIRKNVNHYRKTSPGNGLVHID